MPSTKGVAQFHDFAHRQGSAKTQNQRNMVTMHESISCDTVLNDVVHCCTMLHCVTVLHDVVHCCTVLHCVVQYCVTG